MSNFSIEHTHFFDGCCEARLVVRYQDQIYAQYDLRDGSCEELAIRADGAIPRLRVSDAHIEEPDTAYYEDQINHAIEHFAWSSKIVKYPCDCNTFLKRQGKLRFIIFHLNDICGWSRDQIADWLDKLHDDGIVDLSLPTPNN